MKFHLIYRSQYKPGKNTIIGVLFEKACADRGIELILHDFVDKDYVDQKTKTTLSSLPTLGDNDLLYNSTMIRSAVIAERMMLNQECTHFYKHWESTYGAVLHDWFVHKKYNLPVIPTFPDIPATVEERDAVAESLGGFPLVVKINGGSCGIGVMRVDSPESYASLLDYLKTQKVSVFIRKYIEHNRGVRAVVVGDKVVAAYAAYTIKDEFRANAGQGKKRREVVDLPKDFQKMAVQAVQVLGVETGGVDILFDAADKPHLAEVNFPHNFNYAQEITGVDIAGAMLDHLVTKANTG